MTGDRASTERIQDCSNKVEETLSESSSADTQDRTYISETDMDAVEDAQSEGQRSIQAPDSEPVSSLEALETVTTVVPESPPTEVEEDDAFKLVREIFFTKD